MIYIMKQPHTPRDILAERHYNNDMQNFLTYTEKYNNFIKSKLNILLQSTYLIEKVRHCMVSSIQRETHMRPANQSRLT